MAPIKWSNVETDTDDGRVYVVTSALEGWCKSYQPHPSWPNMTQSVDILKMAPKSFDFQVPKKKQKIHLSKKMDTRSVVSLK
jgi:hypothetical protein